MKASTIGLAAALAAVAGTRPLGHHLQSSGAGSNDGTKRNITCRCGKCKPCRRAIESARAKRERRQHVKS